MVDRVTGDLQVASDAMHAHAHAHGIAHEHLSAHEHELEHERYAPAHSHSRTIAVEQEILAMNQTIADGNRRWFAERRITALNVLSSPGAGKTTLLEQTIRDLQLDLAISVIEGDQATSNDAERIRSTGCNAIQINTGTGCHLEAAMLARGLVQLRPAPASLLMIENVGNLVCPALFDLGERAKVVVLSVTEGEDKPVKYPHIFRACKAMLLNKIDLLPHLRFSLERCVEFARQVNPHMEIFPISAETGEGMSLWYDWLHAKVAQQLQIAKPWPDGP